jgi:hypothetical protein
MVGAERTSAVVVEVLRVATRLRALAIVALKVSE